MKPVTRDEIRKIFKKVKKLRIPEDLEDLDFDNLKYYAWLDPGDQIVFMIYDYKGIRSGVKWDTLRMSQAPLKQGFCEICNKHRPAQEMLLITSKTRKMPKGVDYRVRGNYICSDFMECNKDIKDESKLEALFSMILEEE